MCICAVQAMSSLWKRELNPHPPRPWLVFLTVSSYLAFTWSLLQKKSVRTPPRIRTRIGCNPCLQIPILIPGCICTPAGPKTDKQENQQTGLLLRRTERNLAVSLGSPRVLWQINKCLYLCCTVACTNGCCHFLKGFVWWWAWKLFDIHGVLSPSSCLFALGNPAVVLRWPNV